MIVELINEFFASETTVFFVYYVLVTILSALLYKLGFAKKLPILKSVLIYALLAVGSVILAILGLGMPIAEILVVGVLIMAVVRWRMSGDPNERPNAGETETS